MIIVTGASGGIGRIIVEKLSEFDSVIAVYNSSKPIEKNLKKIK